MGKITKLKELCETIAQTHPEACEEGGARGMGPCCGNTLQKSYVLFSNVF